MKQLLKPLEALNDAYAFEKLSSFCTPNYWENAKIYINDHVQVFENNWGHHELNISFFGDYKTLNHFLHTIHEIDPCIKCDSWQYNRDLHCDLIQLTIYPSHIGCWLVNMLQRMM